ncbi:MAG: hypothetical protein QXZ17_05515 [Nitrososphaerota archaeon]
MQIKMSIKNLLSIKEYRALFKIIEKPMQQHATNDRLANVLKELRSLNTISTQIFRL